MTIGASTRVSIISTAKSISLGISNGFGSQGSEKLIKGFIIFPNV